MAIKDDDDDDEEGDEAPAIAVTLVEVDLAEPDVEESD